MANCKIVSLQEKIDKGQTPSAATAAKTTVLFDHRDQVWALQSSIESDLRDAFRGFLAKKEAREMSAASVKAVPPTKG